MPEKSANVSKPPERPRGLNQYGQIEEKDLESGVLVNRMTADWYLPMLRARSEWKLGFLAVVADEDEAARGHFDQALAQDRLLQRAVGMEVFNAYDRLLMSLDNNVFIGREEDMEGLRGKVRLAMHWADFHFMLENFDLAKDLYRRIQRAAKEENHDAALIRATVGEVLVRNARKGTGDRLGHPRLYAWPWSIPRRPATPLPSLAVRDDFQRGSGELEIDLRSIIKDYPTAATRWKRGYNHILRHPWKYHDERHAMIEQFKRDYPNEKEYHEYLGSWTNP